MNICGILHMLSACKHEAKVSLHGYHRLLCKTTYDCVIFALMLGRLAGRVVYRRGLKLRILIVVEVIHITLSMRK